MSIKFGRCSLKYMAYVGVSKEAGVRLGMTDPRNTAPSWVTMTNKIPADQAA